MIVDTVVLRDEAGVYHAYQMMRPAYDCEGGCGRQWRGEPGWGITTLRTIEERKLITSANCPDCSKAKQPTTA